MHTATRRSFTIGPETSRCISYCSLALSCSPYYLTPSLAYLSAVLVQRVRGVDAHASERFEQTACDATCTTGQPPICAALCDFSHVLRYIFLRVKITFEILHRRTKVRRDISARRADDVRFATRSRSSLREARRDNMSSKRNDGRREGGGIPG